MVCNHSLLRWCFIESLWIFQGLGILSLFWELYDPWLLVSRSLYYKCKTAEIVVLTGFWKENRERESFQKNQSFGSCCTWYQIHMNFKPPPCRRMKMKLDTYNLHLFDNEKSTEAEVGGSTVGCFSNFGRLEFAASSLSCSLRISFHYIVVITVTHILAITTA